VTGYNIPLAILGKLLRLFEYLFSGVLCLGLIGLGAVVLLSDSNNFTLAMIPWWTGRELARNLLLAGIAGLVITVLAVKGRLKFLMVLWTAAVVGTMIYGFFLSSYKYDDYDHFRTSLLMTGAAFAAFLGSITALFARPSRRA
jgi:hypothetical protein